MKKEITAADMHRILNNNVFMDVILSRVATMSDDERRQFTIAEVDKLLGQRPYGNSLDWFIGQFLEDINVRRLDNPLYQEDSALARWYVELAELGLNLKTHIPIDLNQIEPGLGSHPDDPEQDYTLDNGRLTDWLRSTPYRRVAALVARIMLEREYGRVVDHFDAVQDYYAEHCRTDFLDIQKTEQCEEFIKQVLDSIDTVSAHQQRGRELGLNDEEMRVVDALWGWMPHDYQQEYVAAAREICQAVEASLPAPTAIRSRKGFAVYKKPVLEQMEAIAKKNDLDVDLTDKYNITLGYLSEWLFKKYMGDQLTYDDPLNGYKEF